MDKGVVINRPPRDGHMAFIRSPDGISIELLQRGQPLPPQDPWQSMPNTGVGEMANESKDLQNEVRDFIGRVFANLSGLVVCG
jgi:hypothetical protein